MQMQYCQLISSSALLKHVAQKLFHHLLQRYTAGFFPHY